MDTKTKIPKDIRGKITEMNPNIEYSGKIVFFSRAKLRSYPEDMFLGKIDFWEGNRVPILALLISFLDLCEWGGLGSGLLVGGNFSCRPGKISPISRKEFEHRLKYI